MKLIKNEKHTNFVRYRLVQEIKKNLKKYQLPKIINKEALDGFSMSFVYGTVGFKLDYSKSQDRLFLSEIKPEGLESHIEEMIMVLEKEFGKPTLRYDMVFDDIKGLSIKTYEWAEKGKDSEALDEVLAGEGLTMAGARAENVEFLSEEHEPFIS